MGNGAAKQRWVVRATAALFSLAAGLVVSVPNLVLADSVSPSSYETTLGVGESVTINKTVTIDAGRPTTSLVDVFFLADTTGSMGGAIASVIGSASTILTNTASLGNVQFGVGEYKDVGDSFVYRTNTVLTANQATVQAGINLWGASGGGDFPEANIFALQQVANTTPWRAGSARILVWFGDAPGHDPSSGATEATATAALQAQNIKVQALNVGGGGLDSTGQATRITAATGGQLFNGIASADVATAIETAITAAFSTYSSVCLSPSGNLPGVGVATSGCINGSFDRSIERTFNFTATFTGLTPGDHSFVINATVDGGTVATEKDLIHVGGAAVPEPASLLLLGTGLVGLSAWRLRRKA